MMNPECEQQSALIHSIAVLGQKAVGKEVTAKTVSKLLGMPWLITGNTFRGVSLVGLELGLFTTEKDEVRLKRERATVLSSMLYEGHARFKVDRRVSLQAQFFLGDRNMTKAIAPRRNGFTRQDMLEPAAAAVATVPLIRQAVNCFLNRSIRQIGETVVVTKNPQEFMPDIKHVFVLKADREISAKYRLMRNIAATTSLRSEQEYLNKADGFHARMGLERNPRGATVIDTTSVLLHPGGLFPVAHAICDMYRYKRGLPCFDG